MSRRRRVPIVLLVGALPPPLQGMTVFTRLILSRPLPGLRVVHLDTSDHRPLDRIARLDLGNVFLALRHLAEFAALLLIHRPDLAYLPIAQGRLGYLRDGLFLVLARLTRTPCVVHLHGSALTTFRRETDPITRAWLTSTLSSCRGAIVLSPSLVDEFRGLVPRDRTHVVSNGVAPPGNRQTDPPLPDEFRIGYLGQLSSGKGTPDLLEAFALLLRSRPELTLHISGEWYDPEAREAVRRRLDTDRDLARRVHFRGILEGAAKDGFLADLDLFVFVPRQREGQPLILLEAISHGLPIVTTPTGAIAETVPGPDHALHIDPGDPPSLARAIETLLDDPDRRNRMGSANRDRYRKYYTGEACSLRLAEVLTHCARHHP